MSLSDVSPYDAVEALRDRQNEDPANRSTSAAASPAPQTSKNTTTFHEGRVRSGQKLVNENGDLIIEGDVNPGAELVASGNIHVYGTLAGRAYAGKNGDETARVFCLRFNAELVSIAGAFRGFEEVPSDLKNKPFMFRLQEGKMEAIDLS